MVTGRCVYVCMCVTGHTQLEVGVHATYLKLTTGNNNCDILADNNNKWKNIVPYTKHSHSIFLFLLIYLYNSLQPKANIPALFDYLKCLQTPKRKDINNSNNHNNHKSNTNYNIKTATKRLKRLCRGINCTFPSVAPSLLHSARLCIESVKYVEELRET